MAQEQQKPKYDAAGLMGTRQAPGGDPALDTHVRRTLSGVGSVKPEEHAEALRLGKDLGIDPYAAASALRGASPGQQNGAKYDARKLMGSAATKSWLSDPNNAAIGQDVVSDLVNFEHSLNERAAPPGFLEDMGESVATGAFQMQRSWYWLEHIAGWSTDEETAAKLMQNSQDTQAALARMSPTTQDYRQRLDEAQGILNTLGVAFSDMQGFLGLSVESFVASTPGMALGGIGGLAAGGIAKAAGVAAGRLTPLLAARGGAAVGTYYGTKAIEVGAWMDQAVGRRSPDGQIGNQEQLLAALRDPELMAAASAESERKGIGTGVLEALSVLIAGRKLGKASGFKGAVKAGAKEFVQQTALEGAGEATGQVLAYEGDLAQVNWKDVALESALSTGQSTVEIAGGAIAERFMGGLHRQAVAGDPRAVEAISALAKGAQSLNDHQAVSEAMEKWAAMPLKERSPERGKDFITKSAARVGITHAEIDPVAWSDHWKGQGVSPVEALQTLMGKKEGAKAHREGLANGAIRVPIGDWVQGLAGTPDAEPLNLIAGFRAGAPTAEQTENGLEAAEKGIEEAVAQAAEEKQQLADAQTEIESIDKELEAAEAEEAEQGATLGQADTTDTPDASPEGGPPTETPEAAIARHREKIQELRDFATLSFGDQEVQTNARLEIAQREELIRRIEAGEVTAAEGTAPTPTAEGAIEPPPTTIPAAPPVQTERRLPPRPTAESLQKSLASWTARAEASQAEGDTKDAEYARGVAAQTTEALARELAKATEGGTPTEQLDAGITAGIQSAEAVKSESDKVAKQERIKGLREKRRALAATVAQLTTAQPSETEKLLAHYTQELLGAGRSAKEAEVGAKITTALIQTFSSRYQVPVEKLVAAIRIAKPETAIPSLGATIEQEGAERPFTGYWLIGDQMHKLPRKLADGGTHRSWAAKQGTSFAELMAQGAAAIRAYGSELAVDVGGMVGSDALSRAQAAVEKVMADANEQAEAVTLTIGDREFGRLPLGTFLGVRSMADLGRAARDLLGPGGARLFQGETQLPALNTWYFSFAERVVAQMPKGKLGSAQWMKTLKNKGVKDEELEWLLLEDWLKRAEQGGTHAPGAVSSTEAKRKPGPISRDEVLDYIHKNQIHVKEVLHGDTYTPPQRSTSAQQTHHDMTTWPDPDEDPQGWQRAFDREVDRRVDDNIEEAVRERVEEAFDEQVEAVRESAMDNAETAWVTERDETVAIEPLVEPSGDGRFRVTWAELDYSPSSTPGQEQLFADDPRRGNPERDGNPVREQFFDTEEQAEAFAQEIVDETDEDDYKAYELHHPYDTNTYHDTEREAEGEAESINDDIYREAIDTAERELRESIEEGVEESERESLGELYAEDVQREWEEELERRESEAEIEAEQEPAQAALPAPAETLALPETAGPSMLPAIPDRPTKQLKFGSYLLAGGKKPRELLLTLALPPGRDAPNFNQSHWDTKDVLAHVRFDERITADGKRMLFVQEIQSDWHQKGRDQGYQRPAGEPEPGLRLYRNGLPMETSWPLARRAEAQGRLAEVISLYPHYTYELREEDVVPDDNSGNRVPDAPFKATWPELAFRRVLRWAAENGYEQVGWTTGKMQAQRYSLSRQIDALRFTKNEDGTIKLEPIKNGQVQTVREPTDRLTEPELARLVGRELAAKIMAGEGERAQTDEPLLSVEGVGDHRVVARFLRVLGTATPTGVVKIADEAAAAAIIDSNLLVSEDGDGQSGFRTGFTHSASQTYAWYEDNPWAVQLDDGRVVGWFDEEVEAQRVVDLIKRAREAIATKDVPDAEYTGPREIRGLDMDVGGAGMVAFYDQMLPSLAKKLLKPWGVSVGTATFNTDNRNETVQAVDITEQMRQDVLTQGFRLMQEAQAGGPRGATNISGYGSDRVYNIGFFENANKSTFFHELGHTFLDIMGELAQAPDASPQLVADYNTALAAMGTNHRDIQMRLGEIREIQAGARGRDLTRDEKARLNELAAPLETWAKLFEAYLREGKAPSKGLERVFATLKGWLTRIYTSLTGLGVTLTPEVREVMDRMLATDAEILAAKQQDGGVAAFAVKPPEWTEEQWAEYQLAQQEALDVARAKLLRQLMAETSRAEKEIREDELAKIRKRVAKEVDATPAGQAHKALVAGEFKLDRASVEGLYGKQGKQTQALSDAGWLAAEGGTDIQHAAEGYGMSSGDALAQGVLLMQDKEALVEKLSRARLLVERPDLMTTPEIKTLAKEAIANKEALDVQREEYATLVALVEGEASSRKDAFAALPSTKTLRLYARDVLSRKPVREIKPHVYERQTKKHSRAAAEFYAAGKNQEAAKAKFQEIMNRELAAEAHALQDRAEKNGAYLKRMGEGRVQEMLGLAGHTYQDSMNGLLAGYDFTRKTNTAIDRKNALAAWIAERQAEGREPDIAPHLLDANLEKNWRELTPDELTALREAAEQIHHMAKTKDKLLSAAKARKYQATKAMLIEQAKATGKEKPDPRRTKTRAEKRLDRIGAAYGSHSKMARLARIIDGIQDLGPFLRTLVAPLNAAATAEEQRVEKETKRLAALFGTLPDVHTAAFSKPMLVPGAGGLSLSHEDRLGIAALWGRVEGRQRLLDRYTRQEIDAILATLDATDVAFLNGLWAYHESFWGEIVAKWKRVRGVAPRATEAAPYEVAAGKLTGGYHKIKYADRRAYAHAVADQAKLARRGAFTAAVTRSGYAEETLDKVLGRKVRTDLGVVFETTQEIIHDLTHHETLIDVEKLLQDKELVDVLDRWHGEHVVSEWRDLLTDIAAGDVGHVAKDNQLARWVRVGVTDSNLTWKVMSSFVNITGITQSMRRIGPKWVLKGMRSWAGSNDNILGTVEWVYEQSKFMRGRPMNFHVALNDLRTRLDRKDQPVWREYGYAFMQMTQLVVDMPTWLGQYEKTMGEGGSHEDAVLAADQAVRDSQGSAQTVDLAAVQRGSNDWKRMFTVFYFYANTTFGETAETVARYRQSDRDLAKKGQLIVGLMLLFTVPIVMKRILNAALRGEDEPEDETAAEYTKRLSLELIAEHVAGLLDLGLISREFSGMLHGRHGYSGSAGTRLIGDTYALAAQVMQGEADQALRKALLNVTGDLTGWPTAQINTMWDGIQAIHEGRAEGVRVLTAPIFGPPRR